jgi:hypothetical protein
LEIRLENLATLPKNQICVRCPHKRFGVSIPFGRRDSIASFSLSSELNLSGLVGRPMAIPKYVPRRTIIQRISDS